MVSGPACGPFERQRDRVADAEAHAEMAGANDVHGQDSNRIRMVGVVCRTGSAPANANYFAY